MQQGALDGGVRPAIAGLALQRRQPPGHPVGGRRRVAIQTRKGLPQRLLRTQLPASFERLRRPRHIPLQQPQLALQAVQLRVRGAAGQRLLQRLVCPARLAPEQQAARPGDVGEHIVGKQLEAAFVAMCRSVGETEQFQFTRDLHLTEAHALGGAQRQVGLQRLHQLALFLLQVRQRGARALIVRVQRDCALVIGHRARHRSEAVMGVPPRGECGRIVGCGTQYPVRFEQCLLRLLGGAIEQAGIGRERTRQPASRGGQVRVDLQGLPIQRDGARVVAGLADPGVVVGTLQQRLRRRARAGAGPGHDRHDHDHDGGTGGRTGGPPAPARSRMALYDARDRLQRRAQLVAAATHRADVARLAAVIAEGLAEQLHPLADGVFADHRRGPDLLGEGIEGRHVGAVGQQAIEQPPTEAADRQQRIATPHLLRGAVDVQVQQAHGFHAAKHRAPPTRHTGAVGVPAGSVPSLTARWRRRA